MWLGSLLIRPVDKLLEDLRLESRELCLSRLVQAGARVDPHGAFPDEDVDLGLAEPFEEVKRFFTGAHGLEHNDSINRAWHVALCRSGWDTSIRNRMMESGSGMESTLDRDLVVPCCSGTG